MSDAAHSTVVPAGPYHISSMIGGPLWDRATTYTQPISPEEMEQLHRVIDEAKQSQNLMFPVRREPELHPAVAAFLQALLAPQNNAQRLAVAVLMGDLSALAPLVDAVKEELLP